MVAMQWIAVDALKPNPRNARTHSRKQIRQIADSITAFGFLVPILIDDGSNIIAGGGRHAAAVLLGLQEVPVIRVEGLSEGKRRALALADNKIAQNAGWDRELLASELPELAELLIVENLEISITGFAPVEIDQISTDFEEDPSDPADAVDPQWTNDAALSRRGDLWELGQHRLLCGDARHADDLARLLGRARAAMAFLDPPYNVRVPDIVGRGQINHAEFAMASGELSRTSFVEFLQQSLAAAAAASREGAIHFVCTDWKHLGELLEAGGAAYEAMINLVVWAKTNAGQGSFYRSAHELIGVFRVGTAADLNNVELGRHGRSRSNVWNYAGAVKPVALVADAIKDCTGRGAIVLDTFCGAGTTILAAERVGRRAYTLEIEPRFVDLAIRRWQAFSRKDAIHVDSGLSFDELASKRVAATTPDIATTDVR